MDPSQTYADMEVNSILINKDITQFVDKDGVTKQYVDQKVADLVDSAPGVLDTLNELAASLGQDPNFATSVASQISGVQNNVDAEVSARVLSVSDEAAARAAGDQSLQQAAAIESSARQLEEQRIEGKVDLEIADRTQAISDEASARALAVSAEESRALAAEGQLASDISALQGQTSADFAAEIVARDQAIEAESELRVAEEARIEGKFDQGRLDDAAARDQLIAQEADERVALGDSLEQAKLDKSDKYSKREDGNLSIPEDAFLYIGDWRIRASSAGGPKKLLFEYSSDGGVTYNVGIPFIRS